MPKVFRKNKYQTEIISKENFEKWKSQNPEYNSTTWKDFQNYWRALREEIFVGILDNSAGVDLPLYLGNFSVRIIDKEFKCAEDFNKSILMNKETGEYEKRPFITSDIPKKAKIAWVKHKLFKSLPKVLCVENQDMFKKTISEGIRNRENEYQKAFKHTGIKSKCVEEPEKSLFDQA